MDLKFRLLAKNKGSHQDYINLYKEMKKEKDNQESFKTFGFSSELI